MISFTEKEVTTATNGNSFEKLVAPQNGPREYQMDFANLITMAFFHVSAIYGLYFCFTEAYWYTIISELILLEASIIGITAGAHRLWSHKAFKASLPLQILLMIFQSLACQNTIYHWAMDHRLHHRYTDTDADPHNAARGIFYSHLGWLLVKKHPEARKRLSTVDKTDLMSNPVVMFQNRNIVISKHRKKRSRQKNGRLRGTPHNKDTLQAHLTLLLFFMFCGYKIPVIATICLILPTIAPMYFWGETFRSSWNISILRIIINWHCIFLVNSLAHAIGNKPYDKTITPTQNLYVTFFTLGEGFHNYHHVFPWDYRASELGDTILNFNTMFIDFFAKIGWAYDLKTVSTEMIARRARKTGDCTNLWEDEDMPEEHKEIAYALNTVKE